MEKEGQKSTRNKQMSARLKREQKRTVETKGYTRNHRIVQPKNVQRTTNARSTTLIAAHF